jgi:hypothetical protein
MSQSAQLFQFPDVGSTADELIAKFDEFYAAYPKRVDKALARAKFMSIVRGGFKTKTLDKDSNSYVEIELTATADELIDAAKRYTRSLIDTNTYKRKLEDKYIPSPAVWLNKGRFED